MNTNSEFDSLIFDMDGTLWDAVDTYCNIWNQAYLQLGIDSSVDRKMLLQLMGMPIEKIMDTLLPPGVDRHEFAKTLSEVDADLLPRQGGRLYPGVSEYLPLLAKRYKLFMVSNCGEHGLDYFLDYTNLRPFFTDTLSHGQTHLPKEGNIDILRNRYQLKSPLYIGDTQGDCDSSHAAGVKMLHVEYGFGTCTDADFQAGSFREVATLLL